jgi:hypothetical protein
VPAGQLLDAVEASADGVKGIEPTDEAPTTGVPTMKAPMMGVASEEAVRGEFIMTCAEVWVGRVGCADVSDGKDVIVEVRLAVVVVLRLAVAEAKFGVVSAVLLLVIVLLPKQVPGRGNDAKVVASLGPTPKLTLSICTPAVAKTPASIASSSVNANSHVAFGLEVTAAEYVGMSRKTPDSNLNPFPAMLKSNASLAPSRSLAETEPLPDLNWKGRAFN